MRPIRTASLCLAIALLTLTAGASAGEKADVRIDPGQARQVEESAKLQAALARKVSVEFEATPLAEVLVFIRTVGRVGLIVAPEVRDTDRQTVTLTLKEAPLRDVLDRVLGPAGLEWKAHQGSVRVSPAAAAKPAGEGKGAAGAERECVEFVQTPASQVVSFVADRTGVNIVVDPKVREKLKIPVTFKTRGMTYRQVLDWALKLSGTAW
ncbi:MAG: STN domain-containing protein, partial [Planctomycetota bacterium]